MTVVAESLAVTDAYLAALRAIAHPAGGTVQIGDVVKPESPAKPPRSFYPYAVLHVGTSRLDGSLLDPKEDGLHRVQVTCVGLDRRGAEWLRDRAREVLCDPSVSIDDHAVNWTEMLPNPPTFREDDVSPPVFTAVCVANVYVTPTSSGS